MPVDTQWRGHVTSPDPAAPHPCGDARPGTAPRSAPPAPVTSHGTTAWARRALTTEPQTHALRVGGKTRRRTQGDGSPRPELWAAGQRGGPCAACHSGRGRPRALKRDHRDSRRGLQTALLSQPGSDAMLLASAGLRPGTLLNTLQDAGHPTTATSRTHQCGGWGDPEPA